MELNLDRKIKAISVLADSTRGQIFHWIIQNNPVTTKGIAERFSLHPNVARGHLDKMEEIGLLRVELKRQSKGGRPAKVYYLGESPVDMQFPPRQYYMLSHLLYKMIDTLGPKAGDIAETIAHEMGEEIPYNPAFNLRQGGNTDFDAIMRLIAEEMDAFGFHSQVLGVDARSAEIKVNNCVFNELAVKDPKLICRIDLGFLRGMLSRYLDAFSVESEKCITASKSHCCLKISLPGERQT